jgi:hypothetical protein
MDGIHGPYHKGPKRWGPGLDITAIGILALLAIVGFVYATFGIK